MWDDMMSVNAEDNKDVDLHVPLNSGWGYAN